MAAILETFVFLPGPFLSGSTAAGGCSVGVVADLPPADIGVVPVTSGAAGIVAPVGVGVAVGKTDSTVARSGICSFQIRSLG